MRRYLMLLLAVALTAVAGASGATSPASSKAAAQQNLSSRAGVESYLTSLGVNPKGVVVQRGARNYAGPSCPGKGWTCTKASRVLQIANHGGDDDNDDNDDDNRFQCTPSTGGSVLAPDTCVIVQVSTDGNNWARCTEHSRSSAAAQSCSINQLSVSGNNVAWVKQSINVEHGSAQDVSQIGSVTQKSGSGRNGSYVDQHIKQHSKSADSTGAQTQEGHQSATVDQQSTLGDNGSVVDQSLAQDAESHGQPTTTQKQNASNGQANTDAEIDQTTTSGRNGSLLNQRNKLDADAKKSATVNQTQGSQNGGLRGSINQNASGISLSFVSQKEKQELEADGRATSLTQKQFGPLFCCSSQYSNTANRFKIGQSSVQDANAGAFQQNELFGNCSSSGECAVDQSVTQNGQTITNSCTGSFCNIGIFCAALGNDNEVPPGCVQTSGGDRVAPPQLLSVRRGR